MAALNTAFARHGLWIRVPAGTVVRAPIHLVLIGSARERIAAQPRIVIEAGPGAQATFVQHFIDCGSESRGWSNSVTQLKQAAGSRLGFYRLQRHARGVAHTSLLSAELGESAELTAGYFDLGGRLVRNDIAIALRGRLRPHRSLRLAARGRRPARRRSHRDSPRRAARRSATRTFAASSASAAAASSTAKSSSSPAANASTRARRNDNLLLGEHAEIDTKPELEIYANDVKCSHGSTVGELDAEQLFYLRARGLPPADARRLLTTAFATTVVEQIADADFRSEALAHVTARLATIDGAMNGGNAQNAPFRG